MSNASRIVFGPTLRPTRFPELAYALDAPNCWRIYDATTQSAVGSPYKTKAELLADLDRYAREFGCNA